MQPDQDELNELAEELQAKQKKLQTAIEILSDSEKRKIAKEIENMQADAQFASQKLQKYAQDKNQEILQSLAPAYEKVLNGCAIKKRRHLGCKNSIDICVPVYPKVSVKKPPPRT